MGSVFPRFLFSVSEAKYAEGVTPHSPGLPRMRLPWVSTPHTAIELCKSSAELRFATLTGNAVKDFQMVNARYRASCRLCSRLALMTTGFPAEGLSLFAGR